MTDIISLLGGISLIVGALVFATAGLGFIRFPDVFMRVSAIGTAGGIGIILVVLGALLQNPSWTGALMVAAIIVIQLATSAIGSTAVARSALLTGTKMQHWTFNDLAEDAVELRSSSPAGSAGASSAATGSSAMTSEGDKPGP